MGRNVLLVLRREIQTGHYNHLIIFLILSFPTGFVWRKGKLQNYVLSHESHSDIHYCLSKVTKEDFFVLALARIVC